MRRVASACDSQSLSAGKAVGRRRIEQALHRPAVRVAADDDVLDAKTRDREFDRRRFAAAHGAVGRHEIAGVAQDEKVSGRRLGEQARVDTRIGAGDEQRLRRLAFGEAFEQFALAAEHLRLEVV